MILSFATAWAQDAVAPQPIPTPPIPERPRLRPAPAVTLPAIRPPLRPSFDIPDQPALSPIIIPAPVEITKADPADPAPPPRSAALSGPPPAVSPGSSSSGIRVVAFIVDPGASQFNPAAMAKLGDIQRELAAAPTARLEVRAYSPAKPRAESNAHRLSLARFIAVRDFLVKGGIDDNRIDGRALISDPTELNGDRVELYIER